MAFKMNVQNKFSEIYCHRPLHRGTAKKMQYLMEYCLTIKKKK